MSKILYGCDMSHHQSESIFASALKDQSIDFIILKATEGKTFKDSTFKDRARRVIEAGKFLGAYHYARPENNDYAKDEVDNFMESILSLTIPSTEIWSFLDVEGVAVNYSNWVASFIATASAKYGHDMGIYSSVSFLNNQLKSVIQLTGCPVWVAHYNHKDDSPESGCVHFEGESIFQRASTPYDLDTCYVEWRGQNRSEQSSAEQIDAALDEIKQVLNKHFGKQ